MLTIAWNWEVAFEFATSFSGVAAYGGEAVPVVTTGNFEPVVPRTLSIDANAR